MDNHWFIHKADPDGRRRLSAALGIEQVTSQILINRGFKEVSDAKKFLEPALSDLPHPSFLPDMARAVERIAAAIENKERIALYGDYDVDGITGVALLTRFLRSVGVEPIVFIPNRLAEGYGLHRTTLASLKAKGAGLVITVDCGTRSAKEIEFAKANGLDIIVTDHHEAGEVSGDHVMLNPKCANVDPNFREIAGCGVAFFLMMALKDRLHIEPNIEEHLDLVALGTIADVVPLTGINRVFAKFGMEMATISAKPGIRSLIGVSGLEGTPLKAGNIAFRLAPRINAAGRLGDAYPSFELLTTDDARSARTIAQTLGKLNADRQRVEEVTLGEAIGRIEKENLHKRPAIVVANEKWHAGVIGIVASKLVDRYALPAVVISAIDKKSKGSARSVAGLNMMDALSRCSGLLERFGGHAQAAGLVVDTSKIDAFRSQFEMSCAELSPLVEKKRLAVDVLVEAKDLSMKLAEEFERLEPFGLGNPEPVLCAHDLVVVGSRIVGTNHLKLRVACKKTNISYDGIGFGMGDQALKSGQSISMAFTPQINEWNGYKSLQLKIREIKCSK